MTSRKAKLYLSLLLQGWSNLIRALEDKSTTSSVVENIEVIQEVNKSNYLEISENLRKKIGIKLTSPLNNQDTSYFWNAVFKGGIPLVFWTRYHAHKNINLDNIDEYLTVENLRDNCQKLIDNIRTERQEAYWGENPDEDKLGYHLGFLCDNPNRLPKIKLLQSL